MIKGSKHSEETIRKMSLNRKGRKPWNTGKELKYYPHLKALGRIPWNKGKKGLEPWHNTSGLNKEAPWNKGRKMPEISGEKHPHWKGGVTLKYQQIRKSIEYGLWRTAVFERDDYTCIWCNERGGKLEADHIKPFAFFPELRFAIDNGRTLCHDCHTKTDTYRRRKYE